MFVFSLPGQHICGATVHDDGDSTVNTPTKIVSPAVGVRPNSQSRSEVISGELGAVAWSSLVGKNVTITGNLVIVDTYDLARRGQIKVARSRLFVPTSKVDPNDADPVGTSFEGGTNVANVIKSQKFNDKATIIIDDGSAEQNIFPPILFPELGKTLPSVRIGSTINGVSGKLVKAGSVLLLVPDKPLRWTPAKRPNRPDVGNADVAVSSFNVLNYCLLYTSPSPRDS